MNGISQLSSVPLVCLHSGKKKDMLRTFGIVFVIDSNLIDCNVIQSDRRCVFQDGHLLRSSNDFKTVKYLKRFASNTSHDLSQACDRLTCRAELNGSKYGSSQTVPSHCAEHVLSSKVDSNKLHISHLYPGIESPTINDKLNDKVISKILPRNLWSIIDVNMNAHLAGCVSKTLINSPRFLQGFQKYIVSPEAGGRYRAVDQTLKRHADLPVRNCRDISNRSIFRLIQIRLIYPNYHWLDLAWFVPILIYTFNFDTVYIYIIIYFQLRFGLGFFRIQFSNHIVCGEKIDCGQFWVGRLLWMTPMISEHCTHI